MSYAITDFLAFQEVNLKTSFMLTILTYLLQYIMTPIGS